ncbi:hypothetical protein H4W27_002102 [Nesterenkonia lutea]|uniref:CcoQ/FixQ family Cbb3-type cytochrome c oxidase assembly chaperone n=1 Tax=Nesterenkonia lutea TaxID=272919 RepID=A0ABR9JGC0_9MICC|nr:hypothetical protein [Nesterenkonia lutea]
MSDLSYYVNAIWSSVGVLLLMFVSFLAVVCYFLALDSASRGQDVSEPMEADPSRV